MKKNAKKQTVASIEHESSYIRAYEDIDLLNRPVMRPVRIELEVLKPELYLQALNITQSIVCFGSARVQPEKEAKPMPAEKHKSKSELLEAKKLLMKAFNDAGVKNNNDIKEILELIKLDTNNPETIKEFLSLNHREIIRENMRKIAEKVF